MRPATASMPLGIVVRRMPGVTRWANWTWKAVAVLPGAGPADWVEMRRDGEAVEYHAATVPLEFHRADTEAYKSGLSTRVPSVYVVLRDGDEVDGRGGVEVTLATASPYEAQDYMDTGEEIVEPVPMPDALVAFIRDFVDEHHEDEVFVKRRRDKKRIDLVEDGKGDARIHQPSDVYRAPRRVLQ